MSISQSRFQNFDDETMSIASKHIRPERNLLSAVLSRAILDAFGTAQHDKHIVRSARQWLFSPLTPLKAFSFAWVVKQLDLDPEMLQTQLKKWDLNQVPDADFIEGRLSFLR